MLGLVLGIVWLALVMVSLVLVIDTFINYRK
jgi:hypothetical protein